MVAQDLSGEIEAGFDVIWLILEMSFIREVICL
jgi:hypothetical protein